MPGDRTRRSRPPDTPRGEGRALDRRRHLGAKARALPAGGLAIKDPGGLLKLLGKDRAMIVFTDGKDLSRKKGALADLVRQWVKHV